MSTPDPTTQWTEAMQDLALFFIDLAQVDPQDMSQLQSDAVEEMYDDAQKLQIILADEGEDMTEEINLVLHRMGHKKLEPI